MKVNGSAFKKAREEIRKDAQASESLRGESATGTQEWLANKAQIRSKSGELKALSVRTIQYLEKGTASIQVIDAVSPYLNINGRELILDYGVDSVVCDASSVVDFRPEKSPNIDKFYESKLMISIDPLSIVFRSDDLTNINLESITAKINLNKKEITYKWIYVVALIPGGNGWLGINEEVYPMELCAPEKYRASIMFSQMSSSNYSWLDFINYITNTNDKLFEINVTFNFKNFCKNLNVGISISQMETLIQASCQRYGSEYPFYIQPDSLIWRDNEN